VREVCSAKATPRFSISSVEIFDFLRIGLHRLAPQIPNRQEGGHQGHANDYQADQVEAAIGWRVPPQAHEKLHYESSL
jgi:hypothetical protein